MRAQGLFSTPSLLKKLWAPAHNSSSDSGTYNGNTSTCVPCSNTDNSSNSNSRCSANDVSSSSSGGVTAESTHPKGTSSSSGNRSRRSSYGDDECKLVSSSSVADSSSRRGVIGSSSSSSRQRSNDNENSFSKRRKRKFRGERGETEKETEESNSNTGNGVVTGAPADVVAVPGASVAVTASFPSCNLLHSRSSSSDSFFSAEEEGDATSVTTNKAKAEAADAGPAADASAPPDKKKKRDRFLERTGRAANEREGEKRCRGGRRFSAIGTIVISSSSSSSDSAPSPPVTFATAAASPSRRAATTATELASVLQREQRKQRRLLRLRHQPVKNEVDSSRNMLPADSSQLKREKEVFLVDSSSPSLSPQSSPRTAADPAEAAAADAAAVTAEGAQRLRPDSATDSKTTEQPQPNSLSRKRPSSNVFDSTPSKRRKKLSDQSKHRQHRKEGVLLLLQRPPSSSVQQQKQQERPLGKKDGVSEKLLEKSSSSENVPARIVLEKATSNSSDVDAASTGCPGEGAGVGAGAASVIEKLLEEEAATTAAGSSRGFRKRSLGKRSQESAQKKAERATAREHADADVCFGTAAQLSAGCNFEQESADEAETTALHENVEEDGEVNVPAAEEKADTGQSVTSVHTAPLLSDKSPERQRRMVQQKKKKAALTPAAEPKPVATDTRDSLAEKKTDATAAVDASKLGLAVVACEGGIDAVLAKTAAAYAPACSTVLTDGTAASVAKETDTPVVERPPTNASIATTPATELTAALLSAETAAKRWTSSGGGPGAAAAVIQPEHKDNESGHIYSPCSESFPAASIAAEPSSDPVAAIAYSSTAAAASAAASQPFTSAAASGPSSQQAAAASAASSTAAGGPESVDAASEFSAAANIVSGSAAAAAGSMRASARLRSHPFYGTAGKIMRLELKDFLNHKKLIWTPGSNSNIVSGRNGSGKSALARAIAFCCGGESSSSTSNKSSSSKSLNERVKLFELIRQYWSDSGPRMAEVRLTLSNFLPAPQQHQQKQREQHQQQHQRRHSKGGLDALDVCFQAKKELVEEVQKTASLSSGGSSGQAIEENRSRTSSASLEEEGTLLLQQQQQAYFPQVYGIAVTIIRRVWKKRLNTSSTSSAEGNRTSNLSSATSGEAAVACSSRSGREDGCWATDRTEYFMAAGGTGGSLRGQQKQVKRAAVQKMLQFFNIDLNNPVTSLSQEKSKTLLVSAKEEDLYSFFAEVTGLSSAHLELQQLQARLLHAGEELQRSNDLLLPLEDEKAVYTAAKEEYTIIKEKEAAAAALRSQLPLLLLREKQQQYKQRQQQHLKLKQELQLLQQQQQQLHHQLLVLEPVSRDEEGDDKHWRENGSSLLGCTSRSSSDIGACTSQTVGHMQALEDCERALEEVKQQLRMSIQQLRGVEREKALITSNTSKVQRLLDDLKKRLAEAEKKNKDVEALEAAEQSSSSNSENEKAAADAEEQRRREELQRQKALVELRRQQLQCASLASRENAKLLGEVREEMEKIAAQREEEEVLLLRYEGACTAAAEALQFAEQQQQQQQHRRQLALEQHQAYRFKFLQQQQEQQRKEQQRKRSLQASSEESRSGGGGNAGPSRRLLMRSGLYGGGAGGAGSATRRLQILDLESLHAEFGAMVCRGDLDAQPLGPLGEYLFVLSSECVLASAPVPAVAAILEKHVRPLLFAWVVSSKRDQAVLLRRFTSKGSANANSNIPNTLFSRVPKIVFLDPRAKPYADVTLRRPAGSVFSLYKALCKPATTTTQQRQKFQQQTTQQQSHQNNSDDCTTFPAAACNTWSPSLWVPPPPISRSLTSGGVEILSSHKIDVRYGDVMEQTLPHQILRLLVDSTRIEATALVPTHAHLIGLLLERSSSSSNSDENNRMSRNNYSVVQQQFFRSGYEWTTGRLIKRSLAGAEAMPGQAFSTASFSTPRFVRWTSSAEQNQQQDRQIEEGESKAEEAAALAREEELLLRENAAATQREEEAVALCRQRLQQAQTRFRSLKKEQHQQAAGDGFYRQTEQQLEALRARRKLLLEKEARLIEEETAARDRLQDAEIEVRELHALQQQARKEAAAEAQQLQQLWLRKVAQLRETLLQKQQEQEQLFTEEASLQKTADSLQTSIQKQQLLEQRLQLQQKQLEEERRSREEAREKLKKKQQILRSAIEEKERLASTASIRAAEASEELQLISQLTNVQHQQPHL